MKNLLKLFEKLFREPLYWMAGVVLGSSPASQESLASRPPQSILLIRADGVGDVILTLPSIQAIHALYPYAALRVIVFKHSKSLIEALPFDKEVLVFEKKNWRNTVKLFWRLWRHKSDWAVHLCHTTSFTCGLMARLGGKISVSFEKPRGIIFHDVLIQAPEEHHILKQEAIVRALGYRNSLSLIPVQTTPEEEAVMNQLPAKKSPWIGFYIGNGRKGTNHRWRIEKYAELAGRLAQSNQTQIIVLWGPEDAYLLEPFRKMTAGVRPGPVIAPPTTLKQMAALVRLMDVIVGVPTGPTHLASAQGVPLVALCRDFVWRGWRPLDRRHAVLRAAGDDIDTVTVDDVHRAVLLLLQQTESRDLNKTAL